MVWEQEGNFGLCLPKKVPTRVVSLLHTLNPHVYFGERCRVREEESGEAGGVRRRGLAPTQGDQERGCASRSAPGAPRGAVLGCRGPVLRGGPAAAPRCPAVSQPHGQLGAGATQPVGSSPAPTSFPPKFLVGS